MLNAHHGEMKGTNRFEKTVDKKPILWNKISLETPNFVLKLTVH